MPGTHPLSPPSVLLLVAEYFPDHRIIRKSRTFGEYHLECQLGSAGGELIEHKEAHRRFQQHTMWDAAKAGSCSGAGTSCQAKLGHRTASVASYLNLRLGSSLVSASVQPFGPSRCRSPLACIDQSSVSAPDGAKTDYVSYVCKHLWGYLSETSTDSHWRVDWGPRTTAADFGSEGGPSTDNSNTNPRHCKVEVYPPHSPDRCPLDDEACTVEGFGHAWVFE